MSISFLETQLDVNNNLLIDANAEIHIGAGIGSGMKVKDKSAETVLYRGGVDYRQETIKYKSDNKLVTVAGPSLGAEGGVKCSNKGVNLVAKAELSFARVEGTLPLTDDIGLYGSANLNSNTGVQIGWDGIEVNFFGLGVTLGVGGKYTINTPYGSGGFRKPPMTLAMRNTRTNTNVLYN